MLESSRFKSLCRCNDLHHEIELGVVVGKQAKKVAESEAMGYVGGYCLALDMTARFLYIINTKSNNLGDAISIPSLI